MSMQLASQYINAFGNVAQKGTTVRPRVRERERERAERGLEREPAHPSEIPRSTRARRRRPRLPHRALCHTRRSEWRGSGTDRVRLSP